MLRWTERTEIIGLLVIAIISQATGNVLLSRGMKSLAVTGLPTWSDWLEISLQVVRTPSILLGVGFLIIFFVLFATTLSRADLSFVLPVISSEVVVNVAFANYFLQEAVSLTRWLGVGLISVGVMLVVRSSPRTFGLESGLDAVVPEGNR